MGGAHVGACQSLCVSGRQCSCFSSSGCFGAPWSQPGVCLPTPVCSYCFGQPNPPTRTRFHARTTSGCNAMLIFFAPDCHCTFDLDLCASKIKRLGHDLTFLKQFCTPFLGRYQAKAQLKLHACAQLQQDALSGTGSRWSHAPMHHLLHVTSIWRMPMGTYFFGGEGWEISGRNRQHNMWGHLSFGALVRINGSPAKVVKTRADAPDIGLICRPPAVPILFSALESVVFCCLNHLPAGRVLISQSLREDSKFGQFSIKAAKGKRQLYFQPFAQVAHSGSLHYQAAALQGVTVDLQCPCL